VLLAELVARCKELLVHPGCVMKRQQVDATAVRKIDRSL
jgi:hypothetical protein